MNNMNNMNNMNMNMNMMNMMNMMNNNMNNMNMMNNNMNMMNNNINMMNMMNMNNMNKMNMMNMNNMNKGNESSTLFRLKKEYLLCTQDNDLTQIGCTFALVDNNYYKWKISMIGPKDTPYDNGLFFININFPEDYPKHGAEFKFINKIYHLNVDFKKDLGHICISNLNEWRSTGKVEGKPCYGVKQALFDIFCLFHNQGIDSPYDEKMAEQYRDHPEEFNEEARKWTQQFAKI